MTGIALRAAAIFVGAFLLTGIVGQVRGRTLDPSLWLLDLHDVQPGVRLAGLAIVSALLIAWGVAPRAGQRRRVATGVGSGLFALLAVRDTIGFYSAVAGGGVAPFVPVPLSAVAALTFAALTASVAHGSTRGLASPWRDRLALGLAVVAWAVAFPLAQMLFFGTTDYRRPADAAVVFGARVYANGQPSELLANRIRTGVELYQAGLVPVLVMSGGDGADGYNEATAMREVAIADGVPPSAVVVDGSGVNTEASVANVTRLVADGSVRLPHGKLITVSQAYHLPRVQLAFAAAGIDVLTVPARDPKLIVEMPILVGREVLAFWAYDLRTCLG
ncbi:MAG TPA: YdcF family protein [Candidatus Limnocylindrales bacterium]